VDLDFNYPIRLHGVLKQLVKHRGNFTFIHSGNGVREAMSVRER
jgi:hypothetical protein